MSANICTIKILYRYVNIIHKYKHHSQTQILYTNMRAMQIYKYHSQM